MVMAVSSHRPASAENLPEARRTGRMSRGYRPPPMALLDAAPPVSVKMPKTCRARGTKHRGARSATYVGGRMFGKDKQHQRVLFESERSFRLLVENVADYALYMLDPTGIVTSWNIGGVRIKGYAPEEIVGRHFSCFYTEADLANGKPARALRIAEETGRYEEEGWRVRKDGTFFWASVVIDPIRENGELVGFAKITRDITERREAPLKLEQMQQQLAQSQKLDALGQLTGGVAHDFNNLLMIISGSLHALR